MATEAFGGQAGCSLQTAVALVFKTFISLTSALKTAIAILTSVNVLCFITNFPRQVLSVNKSIDK